MRILLSLVVLLSMTLSEGLAQNGAFRLVRPASDRYQTNGSYLYGEPNIRGSATAHRGIDIIMNQDTVFAAHAGVIGNVSYNPNDPTGGFEPSGCGNYLMVDTTWGGEPLFTLYCHLERPLVSLGQTVRAGQPVAISGNTGFSTGPHLHFEVRRFHRWSQPNSRNRRNAELWVAMDGMGAIYGTVPGAGNSTRVDISPHPKPRPPYTTFGWALTYNFLDPNIGSDDVYQENYAIGDVRPGTYTITALNGAYRRVVTVGAGQVVSADPAPTHAYEDGLAGVQLGQPFPNPARGHITFPLHLAEPRFVRLEVFDLTGRRVGVVHQGYLASGEHAFTWSMPDAPSGVYVFRVEMESRVMVRSWVHIR